MDINGLEADKKPICNECPLSFHPNVICDLKAKREKCYCFGGS